MDNEVAIKVDHISKDFKVYFDKSDNLRDRLIFWNRNKYEVRKVIKDVSFEVKKGEAVALIGKNGCGKSTTLKMLTKILTPTTGSIQMNGRVSSLIELGAGFHMDMTGRENIYINASIFGIKKKEVDKRIDEIIRFSELEEFIDNPVRTYSSGMYMRLAFSVAINVDAQILLIDEILAVGDVNFQEKCFRKLREIKEKGTTIVIVSHSFTQIQRICDRAIWLENGLVRDEGNAKKICDEYVELMDEARRERAKKEKQEILKQVYDANNNEGEIDREALELQRRNIECYEICEQCGVNPKRSGNYDVEFTSIEAINEKGEKSLKYNTGDKIIFRLEYKNNKNISKADFNINFTRNDWVHCYGSSTNRNSGNIIELNQSGTVEFIIDEINLMAGVYFVDLGMWIPEVGMADRIQNVIELNIVNDKNKEVGIVAHKAEWRVV